MGRTTPRGNIIPDKYTPTNNKNSYIFDEFMAQKEKNKTIANTNIPIASSLPATPGRTFSQPTFDKFTEIPELKNTSTTSGYNVLSAGSTTASEAGEPKTGTSKGESKTGTSKGESKTETPKTEEEKEDPNKGKNLSDLVSLFKDAEGYAEYIKNRGIDTEAARNDAYKNRAAEYDRSLSTYGRNAETLARLGLTNSGYSDYMDGVGYAAYIAGLSEADKTKAIQDAENTRGYAEYLSTKEAEAKQQALSLYSALTSGEITSDQAVEYAKFLGLNDEEAQSLGKYAKVTEATRYSEEATTMGTNVYSYISQNGVGTDDNSMNAAIQLLYPNATDEQIESVKQYVRDTVNLQMTGHYNEQAKLISQSVTAGNADISSYEAMYNDLLSSSTDEKVISENKTTLSSSLKNDLLKLYDDATLAASYLASYITSEYGKGEGDYREKKWNKMTDEEQQNAMSGIGEFSSLSNDEQDEFINKIIDRLYNNGNGVLTEQDYNELKLKDFNESLKEADSIQEIANLALLVENGKVGTSSIKESELQELSKEFSDVTISQITSQAVIIKYTHNGLQKMATCKINFESGDKIKNGSITKSDIANFKISSEGENIYISNGGSLYSITGVAQTHIIKDTNVYDLDDDLTKESALPFIRLLARQIN